MTFAQRRISQIVSPTLSDAWLYSLRSHDADSTGGNRIWCYQMRLFLSVTRLQSGAISATEESGGSLSGWYQCFPALDTENSIHIDNTRHTPRAFKRSLELSIQCQCWNLWVVRNKVLWGKPRKKKTQITTTVEMLSPAWMWNAPRTKFWSQYISRYRPSI